MPKVGVRSIMRGLHGDRSLVAKTPFLADLMVKWGIYGLGLYHVNTRFVGTSHVLTPKELAFVLDVPHSLATDWTGVIIRRDVRRDGHSTLVEHFFLLAACSVEMHWATLPEFDHFWVFGNFGPENVKGESRLHLGSGAFREGSSI